MAVKIKTKYGIIDISNSVIATVVGGAATSIYGIVGMASRNQIRDNLNDILKRENYARGVVVRQTDNGVKIEVNIIVSYGTKNIRSLPKCPRQSKIQPRNDVGGSQPMK